MEFNLGSTEAVADSRTITVPGTIEVFNIEEVKFGKNKTSGNEEFKLQFGTEKHFFNNTFSLTEKAAKLFVGFYEHVISGEAPSNDENEIITKLKGKKVALKVTSYINKETGKAGPSLGYAGYARKPELITELEFTPSEQGENERALEAMRNYSKDSNGQSQSAKTPPPGGGSESF